MFEDACKLFEPLLCNVGVGDGKLSFGSRGMGCLVQNQVVLTCEHVLPTGGDIIVQTAAAFHRAEVIAKADGGADFVVLRLTETLRTYQEQWPQFFPAIRQEKLAIGMQLGFLTKRQDEGLNAQLAHFQAGFVSQPVVSVDRPTQVALGFGHVQKGMSGSPVFDSDAELAGLLAAMADDETGVPIVQPITGLDLSSLQH